MTSQDLAHCHCGVVDSRFGQVPGAVPSDPLVQAERQRLITLGLMAFFASLAVQPSQQLGHGRKTDGLGASSAILARRFDRQGVQLTVVHLAHALPDILRLGGVAVRRRQCKGCQRHRCLCAGRPSFTRALTIGPVPAPINHSRRSLMFRRPHVHYGRMPQPVTPYQRAAQVWDDRIGSARVQARNWRLMAFGCLTLAAGLAFGLIWQSTQGTITPWVVEVDRLGQAQTVAPANPFYQPTDPQIAFHLARFIEDVRSLPADAIVLRQNWLRSYDFTTDRGATALNDYARVNDPFAKLGKLQMSVEVSSVIRASPESFRIAWIERRYDNGQLAATERWSAIVSIVIETPRNADRLRKNPLGVYVNAISWSKEVGQ